MGERGGVAGVAVGDVAGGEGDCLGDVEGGVVCGAGGGGADYGAQGRVGDGDGGGCGEVGSGVEDVCVGAVFLARAEGGDDGSFLADRLVMKELGGEAGKAVV